ncbi:MAG TPA: hypothetical protein VFF69_16255, partial [Phycisphaerales bacterium]|nr:hypothetical protein [Phycisphaerales bacterium]
MPEGARVTTGGGLSVGPVAGPLLRDALARLLYGGASPSPEAVSRFIESAPDLGIDLGLVAAVIDRGGPPGQRVRQACMPVVGAGRTLMVFVSGPGSPQRFGGEQDQAAERAAAVLAALRLARAEHGEGVGLVQALAEPGETWAIEGFRLAGLRQITELLYLSRSMRGSERRDVIAPDGAVRPEAGSWPEGVRVRALGEGESDESALERALELSYRDTLDCPELAGLRTLPDIIASHRAVGEYDPSLWWLVERDGGAEGCVLLNHCSQQR